MRLRGRRRHRPPGNRRNASSASQAASEQDKGNVTARYRAVLANWIAEHQLRQADAAQILRVSRPRVSDVVNQNTAKFTIDTLVEMLSRVGKPVRLAVG